MSISYDVFTNAFLAKITEFEFLKIPEEGRTEIIDGYMKRSANAFKKNCKYNLSAIDDSMREFTDDFADDDIDEIVDIISEGMLVQWMKPYLYRQENLENVLNTRDFTTYSAAELLHRIGEAYKSVNSNYIQMIREYSYNHGDLTELHL